MPGLDLPSQGSARLPARAPLRKLFWLLLLLPLLPTIGLMLLAGAADIAGCLDVPDAACALGPLSGGRAFSALTSVAAWTGEAFVFAGIPWGVLLVVAVQKRGGRLRRRLAKAFFGLMVLATMPFLGPVFPMESFSHAGCLPSEGGFGTCTVFGVVAPAVHRLSVLPWIIVLSGGVGFVLFAAYAVVAGVLAARRPAPA